MIQNKIHPETDVPLSDDELVERAQNGDTAAFMTLIERHMNACRKLAMSILNNRHDAEDEVQNACWKAFRYLKQFQRDAKFSTWLSRILLNQCLMKLRQNRRARFLYLDEGALGADVAVIELTCDDPDPERTLERREIGAALEKEIRRIPPLLRDVFVLREVEELPMPDVAEQLGISVAAAKSRLLRARLELRMRMRRYCRRLEPSLA